MDVLVCNGLGIYCGMKTLAWLSMKPYQWQGLWNIPTYKYNFIHSAPVTHQLSFIIYFLNLILHLLCASQGEDKAYSIPVHTVQLGEV